MKIGKENRAKLFKFREKVPSKLLREEDYLASIGIQLSILQRVMR